MVTTPLTARRNNLFETLNRLSIAHQTVEHPALHTVDEGREIKRQMPGGHSKNLFLKDKKQSLALVVAWCDSQIDIPALGKTLGSKGRFSFGRPELMEAVLGVRPGSVTPFALFDADPDAFVWVVVDRRLLDFETVWFHPLENTASTGIAPSNLLALLTHCGFHPQLATFDASEIALDPVSANPHRSGPDD